MYTKTHLYNPMKVGHGARNEVTFDADPMNSDCAVYTCKDFSKKPRTYNISIHAHDNNSDDVLFRHGVKELCTHVQHYVPHMRFLFEQCLKMSQNF